MNTIITFIICISLNKLNVEAFKLNEIITKTIRYDKKVKKSHREIRKSIETLRGNHKTNHENNHRKS